jgi:cytochrome P450
LKNFIHIFNEQAEIMVNLMRKRFDKDGQKQESVEIDDIGEPISLCALDIICETSMGQSIHAQSNTKSDYVRAVLRINDIIQARQKNPLFWLDCMFNWFGEGKEHKWAIDILHSFTKKVINERRKALAADMCTPNERPAFLDLLLELENQGQIDDISIKEEVDTFMFEGHDTTATTTTWAMHLFGCYPEIQQKAYEEIREVCGDSSEVTSDHLSRLKYLECCLKEVLRLYPSVPFIVRRSGDPIKIGDVTIPGDTEVMINIYQIHRDPQYWEDPEMFKPER